jgi:cullin 3
MIKNGRKDELKLLYKCFVREDTNLSKIIHCLNEYIEEKGKSIVTDEKLQAEPENFSQKLLDFKAEIDDLIIHSFSSNLRFEKGRDTSFQQFMNINANTPVYIATYTDKEMRQGIQGLSNEQIDERLTAIVRLFCCFSGRDLYVKKYQDYLSVRLLNKTMISTEAEEMMISKLKMELGINAVNKMT